MKNIIIIFLAIVAVHLVSCSGDENKVLSEVIVDEWVLTEYERVNCPNISSGVDVPYTDADDEGCVFKDGEDHCFFLNFNANGELTVTFIEGGSTQIIDNTYSVNDSLNLVTFCEGNSCDEMTFEDCKLTITALSNNSDCKETLVFKILE